MDEMKIPPSTAERPSRLSDGKSLSRRSFIGFALPLLAALAGIRIAHAEPLAGNSSPYGSGPYGKGSYPG